jgi:hypothetical protein
MFSLNVLLLYTYRIFAVALDIPLTQRDHEFCVSLVFQVEPLKIGAAYKRQGHPSALHLIEYRRRSE